MRRLIAVAVGAISSACSSNCPTCGEACVGSGLPHDYHACSNGHSW